LSSLGKPIERNGAGLDGHAMVRCLGCAA